MNQRVPEAFLPQRELAVTDSDDPSPSTATQALKSSFFGRLPAWRYVHLTVYSVPLIVQALSLFPNALSLYHFPPLLRPGLNADLLPNSERLLIFAWYLSAATVHRLAHCWEFVVALRMPIPVWWQILAACKSYTYPAWTDASIKCRGEYSVPGLRRHSLWVLRFQLYFLASFLPSCWFEWAGILTNLHSSCIKARDLYKASNHRLFKIASVSVWLIPGRDRKPRRKCLNSSSYYMAAYVTTCFCSFVVAKPDPVMPRGSSEWKPGMTENSP